jgi:hypothetical protein
LDLYWGINPKLLGQPSLDAFKRRRRRVALTRRAASGDQRFNPAQLCAELILACHYDLTQHLPRRYSHIPNATNLWGSKNLGAEATALFWQA